jgi:tetratricopeptide (TPR) repeat protein
LEIAIMKVSASIRLPVCLATSLVIAWAPSAVWAAETKNSAAPATGSNVAQLNEEGAALYAARDYRRAIEKFIQAYAVDTDPNLLFNIARCYEELGDVDAAIEKYETFLKTPGADTRGRQRARESLEALREAQKNGDEAEAPSTETEAAELSEPEMAAAPTADADGNPSPVLPWVVLGGTALFAAVGTTFYLLGASDHGKVTDGRGYGDSNVVAAMTRREADDLVNSGDTKKLVGGINFGLAGALAATYVVLLVSADEASPAEPVPGPSLGFSLSPSPDGPSVLVQGSF